jgi:hypothetical protein
METPFRTTNHDGRTNHHHHLHIKASRSHRNGQDRKTDGRCIRRTHPAKAVHKIDQLIRDLHSRKSVMDYLHQHSASLQWEKKLELRTPREKQSKDTRPNKHEKRKERPKERTERSKERTGRNKERTKKPDRGASHKRLKTSRSESGPRPPHTLKASSAGPTARVPRKRQPPQSHSCKMPFRQLKLKHSFQQPGQGPSEEDKAGGTQLWGQEPSSSP